ncbi:serine/arginine repetitive matrix protein 2-like [Canna indica]|uniref:Serine/arginine repetitive matrix protein 2-like n=1 Tax=Canna indica TaxID=4628 RepID=A0AAQ3KVI7_9LILI|nr:serine/arginine repetitive matrix protein 2-like [Canna indica]
MASAVVNSLALSPPPESFPWVNPRISFSYDLAEIPSAAPTERRPTPDASTEDFEFLLDNPGAMLPAEELFSDGKLVPLQLGAPMPSPEADPPSAEIALPEPPETRRKAEIAGPDPYAFSPRAPRCTARWRELLGLRRARVPKPGAQENAIAATAAPAAASRSANARSSLKLLLYRNLKPPSLDASLSTPLLRVSDLEHTAIASRFSLSSSSSSGADHEDLTRLSIDSDKQNHAAPRAQPSPATASARARAAWKPTAPPSPRGASVDSPRMSSSGKIVFQGLERSSSSPGGFTRPRRPRGVERSYSAHVRVTPVLNVVPVRSLRGSSKPVSVFGLSHLFTPQQKKDGNGLATSRAVSSRPVRRQQQKTTKENSFRK